jgi:hypothetical protein
MQRLDLPCEVCSTSRSRRDSCCQPSFLDLGIPRVQYLLPLRSRSSPATISFMLPRISSVELVPLCLDSGELEAERPGRADSYPQPYRSLSEMASDEKPGRAARNAFQPAHSCMPSTARLGMRAWHPDSSTMSISPKLYLPFVMRP